MAGMNSRLRPGQRPVNIPTPEAAYSASIPQQAEDYDSIMGGYRNLLTNSGAGLGDASSRYRNFLDSPETKFTPAQYTQAGEWGDSYNRLKQLSVDGGLDAQGQADLRARGVSPIRAVYANAQRGLDRQRSLQGGYSANYGAATSKMAREQSESTAGAMQNVNAEIAKMIQQGKLQSTPALANMAAGKNNLMNQMNMANSENALKAASNKTALLTGYGNAVGQESQVPLDALRGMTSLYGTTPALVNTFGNQTQTRSEQNDRRANSRTGGMTNMLSQLRRR